MHLNIFIQLPGYLVMIKVNIGLFIIIDTLKLLSHAIFKVFSVSSILQKKFSWTYYLLF